ncbi:MAG: TRAP transporter large permease [Deltaproteobacteria bacterium]|jgi:tripartite ATP-independent transporter DctM subunit|nr:TRAP transporter large permease [Deltaproteobacteria bacterium]
MDPILIGITALICLLALSALGIPVGIALGTVALTGLLFVAGPAMALITLKTLPYALGTSYNLVVIPMFILMGLVVSSAGVVTDLYDSIYRWFSRFRGSMLMVTTAASAVFGAVSGSTVVNATVFTRIALPEMVRLGYKPAASAAAIGAAGTLASLIPPSIAFIIYAIVTEQSIGQLLLAGLLPGILTTVVYLVGIAVCVRLFKDWAPLSTVRFSWKEKFSGMHRLWPLLALAIVVVGGIYKGLTPPSAAGGIGAIGAILIVMLQRRIRWATLWECLKQTIEISAVLFVIVVGGMLFSRYLTVAGFIPALAKLIQQTGFSKSMFLLMVVVFFLFLGMFMDTISILIVTVPILDPIVESLGINPILYAVIIIKLLEIAAISPPFGINLFAVLAATDQPLPTGALYRSVFPFIVLDLITIILLLIFPAISTWLPERMV